jgi:hypothetical protein
MVECKIPSIITLMSIAPYEQDKFESEVYLKLKEAEIQAESTTKRYSHMEVMGRLRAIITGETAGGQ